MVAGGEYRLGGAERVLADRWSREEPKDGSVEQRCAFWSERLEDSQASVQALTDESGIINTSDFSALQRWAGAKMREACEPVEKARAVEQEAQSVREDEAREERLRELEVARTEEERRREERRQQAVEEERQDAAEHAAEVRKGFAEFKPVLEHVSANEERYVAVGRAAILRVMKAPSTTRFVSAVVVAACPDGLVVVEYGVESQNSFGAMVRGTHCALISNRGAIVDSNCEWSAGVTYSFGALSPKEFTGWENFSASCSLLQRIAALHGV